MNGRTGLPNEGWDDGRLVDAYRSLASRPAPADLVRSTIAAAEAAPRDGRGWFGGRGAGGRTWRPRVALASGLLALGLVAVLVGGLALRTSPAATTSVGTNADGLAVRSVSELLAAEANGSIHGDDFVAVRGWIAQQILPACPAEEPRPALEDTCTSSKILLTETAQTLMTYEPISRGGVSGTELAPSGPFLYARELAGGYVDPVIGSVWYAPGTGSSAEFTPLRPLEAILVGHFHDVRAAECRADLRASCEAAFVVDQVAWLDGKSLGPNLWIGGDHDTGQVLKPRLDATGVSAALATSLDPKDEIVSIVAVQLIDIPTIAGAGNQLPGNGADIIWYVRVAGPSPHFPALAWGNGNGGWLVIDDASGQIRGAGGWGFVPANSAVFSPSPIPSPAGGLYPLPTLNWLPGGTCAGVGLDAVLRGSPEDARVAWLENHLGGAARMDVTWPAGYHARFTPKIEILDENGKVVLRDGDAVTGACGNNPDTGLVYLEPPFK